MTFDPIDRGDLPQTITIYNTHLAPETREITYYRTLLKYVRVDERRTTLSENLRGPKKGHKTVIWIDRRNTESFDLSAKGVYIPKTYLYWPEWGRVGEKIRSAAWTLTPQHHFAVPADGQTATITPPFNPEAGSWQDFAEENRLQQISEIFPAIDEDGSIHSWEVTLD